MDEAIERITADYGNDKNIEDVQIAIVPPIENSQTLSDEDSDNDEDFGEAQLNHLPGRLLRSECSVQITTDGGVQDDDQNIDDLHDDDPNIVDDTNTNGRKKVTRGKHDREWSHAQKYTRFSQSFSSNFDAEDLTEFHSMRSAINTPIDAFNSYVTDDFYKMTIQESNLYAIQNHRHLSVDFDELHVFLGVCLLSGYHKLPDRRMYWSEDLDVHCDFISQSISRNRFDDIMRNLHFANNMHIDDDPLYKVRPIFDILNFRSKIAPVDTNLSIDETMIEYFGHHGCKQRIQGKPIRSGFKAWNLATSSGRLIHSELYCGKKTKLDDFGLGHGGNVVIGLLEKSEIQSGVNVHFDNYFTTFSLIERLTEMGIGAVGTIQEKYLGNAPLPEKKAFAKTDRGEYISCKTNDMLLVRWNDNRPVTVVTNHVPIQPVTKVKRYSSVHRRAVHVEMPGPFQAYNQHMGGVDLFDQSFNNYKVRIRSKKWWWPLFVYFLNTSAINAWRLYISLKGQIPLLDFLRSVSSQLIRCHGTSHRRGRTSIISSAADAVRRDGRDHWPVDSNVLNGVCPICRRRTKIRCEKCDTALHISCFKTYHLR